MEEKERVRIQVVLSANGDIDRWRDVQSHYRENYGEHITDSEILRRMIERESTRRKSHSRTARINQTFWLVFDLWQKVTKSDQDPDEIIAMIQEEMDHVNR